MDQDFTSEIEDAEDEAYDADELEARQALNGCQTDDERWKLLERTLAECDLADDAAYHAGNKLLTILYEVAPHLPAGAFKKARAFMVPPEKRIAELRRKEAKGARRERALSRALAASDMAYEEASRP
jgi:hypothetical protein